MKKIFNAKTISLLLAVILLVGGAVGDTLAWIVSESGTVTNTFTYGDINIKLDEAITNEDGNPLDEHGNVVTKLEDADRTEGTDGNKYKMIPGSSYTKDPTVTVLANSEDCWLFVEVKEVNSASTFLSYAVDTAKWTLVPGQTNVYYREVTGSENPQRFAVLVDNKVSVKGTVDKTALASIKENYPQLTFTAYAVQRTNINSVTDAWTVATTGELPTNN